MKVYVTYESDGTHDWGIVAVGTKSGHFLVMQETAPAGVVHMEAMEDVESFMAFPSRTPGQLAFVREPEGPGQPPESARVKDPWRTTASPKHPHYVFHVEGMVWKVLRAYQSPDGERHSRYARWLCQVITPVVPEGEVGDVYICDIPGATLGFRG